MSALLIFCIIQVILALTLPMTSSFGQRLVRDVKLTNENQKAFFVGEYGLASIGTIRTFLSELISSTASGSLLWSLRSHSRAGGFCKRMLTIDVHSEGYDYYSYHFPGFPTSTGFGSDEIEVMKAVGSSAKQLCDDNATAPVLQIPPVLFEVKLDKIAEPKFAPLIWRGTPGAASYSVQTSFDNSTFQDVASGVLDNKPPDTILFNLDVSQLGKSVLYIRIVPANGGEASNIITCKL